MHKKIFALLGTTALLAACASSTIPSKTDRQTSSSSSSVAAMGSSSSFVMMEPGADGQEDEDAPAAARVITITAANFTFSPNAITVKKGEKIILRLQGGEGNHGIGIPDLGINTVIPDGKTVDIELPTDKAGTFSFRCTVPCGPGHKEMVGTITITE